jgi:hypothetical protein
MEATGNPGTGRAAEGQENTGGSNESLNGKAPESPAGEAKPGSEGSYRYDEYDDYIPWEI